MRIFIIHNFYQHAGGEDMVFRQEVQELKRHHTVETLTFRNKKGWRGLWQFLAYPWNLSAQRKVKKQLQHFNPDIVHIHNFHYASGPALIRTIKKRRIPVVMTLHNFRMLCPSATLFFRDRLYLDSIGTNFPWKAVRLKVLENSFVKTFGTAFTYFSHRKLGTFQLVDRFLTLSAFSRQLFLSADLPFFSADSILVKPNFVEVETKTQEREDYYLFVGRLSAEKGIMQLVNTLKGSDKVLKIVGDGPLMAEVRNSIQGVRNIELLGQKGKEETMQLLAKCKALLVPSVCYEGGVPLTIIEGIATQTPIISTNIGAIPGLIIPNQTGWLFDPYKRESILSAITEFENSDKKDDIVKNAHAVYRSTFTKDIVMQQLEEVYQKVIAK